MHAWWYSLPAQSQSIMLGEGYEASIIETRRNPLTKRREIKVVIMHTGRGTPRRYAVREAIAKALGVGVENVYVRKLSTEYGMGRTVALVHVYDSPEEARLFEPQYIIDRNQPLE